MIELLESNLNSKYNSNSNNTHTSHKTPCLTYKIRMSNIIKQIYLGCYKKIEKTKN